MKISKELIIGLALTLVSAYYWAAVGSAGSAGEVPAFFRYTFRLFPYLDLLLTVTGMLIFYKGLMKLRG